MGWVSLCYLRLHSAVSGICSLTGTVAPHYCDHGKFPFFISQISSGMGAGVTHRLQVGGDHGHCVLGPDIVCKTFEFECPFVDHSLSRLSLVLPRLWLLRARESTVLGQADLSCRL